MGGIRLERKENIAIVFMDRPEKQNAFDDPMFDAMARTALDLKNDLPRAIVLTGTGEKAFCAGFDVGMGNPMTVKFLNAVNMKDPELAKDVVRKMRDAVDAFVSLPVPIVAAVNGLAYGGGAELATRCDLRVMDAGAELCFSEVKLGLMPDWGGGPCLSRLIGPGRAADMILTARKVPAEEAFQLGWANRLSEPGCCLDQAMELAGQISRNGPKAVRAALGVLRQGQGLKAALDREAQAAAELIASGECVHGITALMEKKPAQFPD
jgi:enoyl-CoA hydratase